VPKKNHDALSHNLKQFAKWHNNKHGVRSEYYQLSNSETIEGMDSITKTFSIAEDEDVWMELSFSKDSKHWEKVCATMIQDENIHPLIKEFEGLATYMFTAGSAD
jgi:hypothetical protein